MEIELKHISHNIGERSILDDVNIIIKQGECLVITGSSGSGKSLLLNIMCDIIKPTQGGVLIDGIKFTDMSEREYQTFRSCTGVVFQLSALISNLSLQENLLLPLNKHKTNLPLHEKLNQIEITANQFGLSEFLYQRTDQLSIGLSSLASLARAVILQPKVLFWDTPISEVDDYWGKYEVNLLRKLKQHNTTLILCSNNKQVLNIASKKLCLNRG